MDTKITTTAPDVTSSSTTDPKQQAIQNYMDWVMERPEFKEAVTKAWKDYISYGTCEFNPKEVLDKISGV